MNDLIPFDDLDKMAGAMIRSGMFGKTKDQLLSLFLIAQAEGLHPAIAAMEYDVIKGKPAINSKAALSRFQAAGGSIRWIERTDKKASAEFSHPSGGKLVIEWTIERAKTAGLYDKPSGTDGPNMWHKFPAQLLSARVVGEGVRAIFPACLSRMYLVEEVQDFDIPKFPDHSEPETKPAENQETTNADTEIKETLKAEFKKLNSKLAGILSTKKGDVDLFTEEEKDAAREYAKGMKITAEDLSVFNVAVNQYEATMNGRLKIVKDEPAPTKDDLKQPADESLF
jgi:hypothetical protein